MDVFADPKLSKELLYFPFPVQRTYLMEPLGTRDIFCGGFEAWTRDIEALALGGFDPLDQVDLSRRESQYVDANLMEQNVAGWPG